MLWAVHISDGVLQVPWLLGGFGVAGLLLLLSLWRVRDDEVPRIALLSAAFFTVSLIHVRVGPTSVHLLFNGLIGVLLGPRAALAIIVGLFLQFQYLAHGGIMALGVNTCVLTLPALGAWLMFHALHRSGVVRRPACQSALVVIATFTWIVSVVFSVTLLQSRIVEPVALPTAAPHWLGSVESLTLEVAWQRTLHPVTVAAALVLSMAAAVLERRLENAPEFSLGLLIGGLAVLSSVGLNCAVLILGGEQHWPVPPLILLVAHLPIAVLEGVVLGFTLGFVAKVKPEMLCTPKGFDLKAQGSRSVPWEGGRPTNSYPEGVASPPRQDGDATPSG